VKWFIFEPWILKEPLRRNFYEISTDYLGNTVLSLLRQASGQILKDDVNSLSSTSDIFFLLGVYLISAEELTKHKHTIQRCSQISDN
jgi:hypothetical protein